MQLSSCGIIFGRAIRIRPRQLFYFLLSNLQQKLVTGDDSGHVGCYEFKKGAPQTVFLSKVFDGPISCVAIGGNVQKKDKVRNFSV